MATFNDQLGAAGRLLIVRASDKAMDWHGFRRVGGTSNGGGAYIVKNPQLGGLPLSVKDQAKLLDDVRSRIHAAFHPWFYMPDPAGFEPMAREMRQAASRLNRTTTISGGNLVDPNSKLDDLDYIQLRLAKLEGEAVRGFLRHYAVPLPGVIDRYCSIATILGTAITAEQRLFQAARHDVLDIVSQATKAMEIHNDDGSRTLLKIAGALAGAAGVFVGGPGGAAIAVGAVGQLLGDLDTFLPDEPRSAGSPGTISGKTWEDVMEDVESELHRLSVAIERRERTISQQCLAARDFVNAHRRSFDLTSPTSVLNATDPERLGAVKEIRSSMTTLREVGHIMKKDIAHELVFAANRVTDAIDERRWERNPRIGFGSHGAYAGWRALNDLLRELLDDTKWEVVRAGEHLAIAGELIHDSDQEVRHDLAHHHRRYDDGSPARRKDYAASPR